MKPLKHFVIGLVISSLLYSFNITDLLQSILILTSNSLIDSDHYFYYVYRKKDLNFIRAYKWFIEQKESINSVLIFHGIEFVSLLVTLSFIFPFGWWILLGTTIHFFSDMVEKERRELLFKSIVTTKHKK